MSAGLLKMLSLSREDVGELRTKLIETQDEIASVLMILDEQAAIRGDEGVFRTCRDRLRKLCPMRDPSPANDVGTA